MSLKSRLRQLSFRTGVIVLLLCTPFYILSFAQMLLPISAAAKGVLWAVLFGLAKTFQYGGLTILGVEGYKRVKNYFSRKKDSIPGQSAPKLIIFDFDGTLGDSRQLITDTMLATISRLGLPARTREECASTIGLPLAKCFSTIIPMTDEQAERCASTYREIFNEKNIPGAVQPFQGVEETIRHLSARGIQLSIASSRSHHSLESFVSEFGLDPYITYLIGADDVTRHKPDAEPVTKTLSHFALQPQDVLVVGDTEFDILMGRNAGARTCAVTYGNGTREELESAGADHVITRFPDLLSLLP
ncbi:MAG: HAD-IA family hydrolase [Prevotella sp.]|nr:HAD-IA family hydrolase [Prevotella sp.]